MSKTDCPETAGRIRLAEILGDPASGWSQSKIANALTIAQTSVSLWFRRRTRPEPHHREALECLLGIPRDAWKTDDELVRERAVVEHARAFAAAHPENDKPAPVATNLSAAR
jgi:transcriptional regulator with XRE-family HTH domain